MANNESFKPSKPISINTNKNQLTNRSFGSWSPISGSILGGGKHPVFPSASPSNSLPPLSPASPSSLNSQVENVPNTVNLGRRMSLNIGASSLATPFFQTNKPTKEVKATNSPEKEERPLVRRTRTLSTSDARNDNTAGIAEKWGFGIREPKEYSKTLPNMRKTRADFLRETSSTKENRSRSPMRDLILKGQFDM
ncbi:hypothetical protein K502DRAFT_364001 [Neoconidiobolus thromboides FSU 785]|nr:hypothetical protein K502DRAFT_364001 [Neoconidiobolus thromboides FSU 785]